ncbi:FG-GAP repeat domain-containing protein [Patescibacteria group bacterium]
MKTPIFFKSGFSVAINASILAATLSLALAFYAPELASVNSQLPAQDEKLGQSVLLEEQDALFIFTANSQEEMLITIDEVEELGGTVVHRYPPKIASGTAPAKLLDSILALPGVAAVYFQPVELEQIVLPLKADEKLGVLAWNASFNVPPVDITVGDELVGDDLEPSPEMQGDIPADEQISYSSASPTADGAPTGAGFYDTSEYMAGDISVGVILPESTGAIDPSTENWTAAEEALVASEVQAGLNWWSARESLADISFTYHFYYGRTDSKAQTSYEPINRPADPLGTNGEELWVSQIMNQFGYTQSSRLDKVRQFNNDLRDTDDSDWAVTFFVVDSANDGNGSFTDGYFAYMWVGGPYSVMTYDNDGYGINNMDAVAAHELGHGFYANDQYASACTCSQNRGYLDYYNSNCVNSCSSNVTSIMRGQVAPYTVGAVDTYARGQVGIIDANNDGILDVLEVKPSLSLATDSGTIGTTQPKIEGSTNVNKVSNKNPSGVGNDITISTIDEVQYRVNSGNWVDATATDGNFNAAEEDFHFQPTLSKGTSTIEVQSKDTAGNWSDQDSITLRVGEGRIVTMAGYTGGPQLREFTQAGVVTPDSFFAFPSFLRSGARVATGDIDKDSVDEIIVGSGMTARPHVVVYEKNGDKRGIDYRPFSMNFLGGVDVASGDIDGDGKDNVIVSQFTGGNTVKVYKYNSARELIVEFTPFGGFKGGVTVTAGDVDKDGKDEVIVGAGPTGGPQIRVYDIKPGQALLKPISFFAFHPNSRSGIDVAAGDVDGDNKAEIAVTQLFYEEAWTKVYRYNNTQTVLGQWRSFPAGVKCGANVEMFDIDNNGKNQIIVGPNMGGGPQVRGFEYDGEPILNFFAYATTFRGGVVPAGGFF